MQQSHRDAQAVVRAIKLARGCADCGYNAHHEALDFDHVGKKSFEVSRAYRKMGIARILKEITQCEVVCSNCHRVRTAERRRLNESPDEPIQTTLL